MQDVRDIAESRYALCLPASVIPIYLLPAGWIADCRKSQDLSPAGDSVPAARRRAERRSLGGHRQPNQPPTGQACKLYSHGQHCSKLLSSSDSETPHLPRLTVQHLNFSSRLTGSWQASLPWIIFHGTLLESERRRTAGWSQPRRTAPVDSFQRPGRNKDGSHPVSAPADRAVR